MMHRNTADMQSSASDSTPLYKAEDLMLGGQVAHIVLGEQHYILRITRAGKLILTK
ncbi:MAG: Hemin uptake protein [Rhodobacteraceae bacterium HLUCCO07]|nr:MAG: Hemin uptake protein [Rhodobacteraceae bacterium HLUCCO07]